MKFGDILAIKIVISPRCCWSLKSEMLKIKRKSHLIFLGVLVLTFILIFLFNLNFTKYYKTPMRFPEIPRYELSQYVLPINNYLKKDFQDVSQSSRIGAFRTLPDTREDNCKYIHYNLPNKISVSVVISYLNEPRSTLIRTLTSILRKTPQNFLKEIILVDDFSDDANVGMDLQFLPLVRLVRNNHHEGLIRSRNTGAEQATGDYLVFLDSHCEVNTGWLEPLLDRLVMNPGLAASPVLDSIHSTTFEYRKSASYLKGGFNWNLQFQWVPMSAEERESHHQLSAPFMSPSFSGGVFMIARKWFFSLNAFNANLKTCSGESTEMAIKIWLCGGQIEVVPCSRIGHVFSNKHPIMLTKEIMLRNSKIIAESWLDEYKQIFYNSQPEAKEISIPSLEEIRLLKHDLQCRPFSWYLQNVYKELKLPHSDYTAFGEIKNSAKCLTAFSGRIALKECLSSNQSEWHFHAKTGAVSTRKNACLTAGKKGVVLKPCKNKNSQKWTRNNGHLVHNATKLCLEGVAKEDVALAKCRRGALSQLFGFSVEVQKL